jgi:predicted dehydrogenase/threonine dehydrogenase-like Zn-dependent dehydrogenase
VKQVTQRLKDGRIEVRDIPIPEPGQHEVLVRLRASLLSSGTERAKVQTARQSLVGKARERPDQVRRVVDKVRRDGVRETVATVRARLDQPTALGYCAAGEVLAVGERVRGIAVGDRVACGGQGAAHAEFACVPGNLCVTIPDGVKWPHGAFATLGSIALHGVRQAEIHLGERAAVIGLGLVGELCAYLLGASGCSAVGIDLAAARVQHAIDSGAIVHGFERSVVNPRQLPAELSEVDSVIIAASTSSSDPIDLAAAMCRDRGRVVMVGATGMEVPRAPFYGKELELRLSRSYGPGRYDREYEERGLDYPIGYVRWTERRNMRAFLELVATGKVDVEALISHRTSIDDAQGAYDRLLTSGELPLGVVLEYPGDVEVVQPRRETRPAARRSSAPATNLGLIGAGSFAQRILIPSFRSAGFDPIAVASQGGLSAAAAEERFGFQRAVAPSEVIGAEDVGLIAVATHHASHFQYAHAALQAGHPVFVEKPPCLTTEELAELRSSRAKVGSPVFVGFNRRHAPLAARLREVVSHQAGPIEVLYRVNAGRLEDDHWLNDPEQGGGRLLGEGCHFIDFACWLMQSVPSDVSCTIAAPSNGLVAAGQRFVCTLKFAAGSLATILYSAEGASRLSKEYVEVHCNGHSAILDDFRSLTIFDVRSRRIRGGRQDKGHAGQAKSVMDALTSTGPVADVDPLDSMAVTIAALESARSNRAITLRQGG